MNLNTIQVAYDISILGQGYTNSKARTGIYRAVESLLLEIIQKNQIDFNVLCLNKDSSYWDYLTTEIYIENLNQVISTITPYPSNFFLQKPYKSLVERYCYTLKTRMTLNPLNYKLIQAIKLNIQLLDRAILKPDISHINLDLYHSTYFPLPRLSNNLKKVITIYDLIPQIFPDFVTSQVKRRGRRIIDSININKDWITCISENTQQDFCNYTGMNPERVFVTPLAASENFYPVSDPAIISQKLKQYQIPEQPYLLSLCTLEPRKNLNFLLQCFAQLLAQDPSLDLNLVLVGVSGWKNNNIFQTVQNNSLLKKHVIFTGYIPDHDLSAIYSGALAFVYPSLYEGFGLPPLEAMQCGTPVITSNTSSLPEVVGDAGIIINPHQSDDLCQAMLELINNATLRNQLSQKGIDRATQFSWAKCAAETIKVYKIAANS